MCLSNKSIQLSFELEANHIARLILAFQFLAKMPPVKKTKSEFLREIVREHPGIFRCDDSILFCLACDSKVNATQKCLVTQHVNTDKHEESIERKNKGGNNTSQTLLKTLHETTDKSRNATVFAKQLTKSFLEANIPIHKVSHPSIVQLIEEHTKYAAPSETSMRAKYLPTLYDECIERMKNIAANNSIWISIDETTDCEQRYVAKFIFGVLDVENERGRSYLFSSAVLEAANSTTVSGFFDDSVKQLGQHFLWKYRLDSIQ